MHTGLMNELVTGLGQCCCTCCDHHIDHLATRNTRLPRRITAHSGSHQQHRHRGGSRIQRRVSSPQFQHESSKVFFRNPQGLEQVEVFKHVYDALDHLHPQSSSVTTVHTASTPVVIQAIGWNCPRICSLAATVWPAIVRYLGNHEDLHLPW